MLTGKRVRNEPDGMSAEIHQKPYSDDLPLLWNRFSEKGYITAMNEDDQEYGLFHFNQKGFAKKPVDFYYHHFWLQSDKIRSHQGDAKYCFGDKPIADVHLDITKRFVKSFKNIATFMYHFLISPTHGEPMMTTSIDALYRNFFHELYSNGYLNKTLIVMFGDHGHRFLFMINYYSKLIKV